MFARLITCLMLILTLATPTYAAPEISQDDEPEKFYSVQFVLKKDGVVIGQPRIVVRDGTTASISTRQGEGYSLRFATTGSIPASMAEMMRGSGRTDMSRTVFTEAEIFRPDGEEWLSIAKPTLTSELGEASSISVNLARPEASTANKANQGFELSITVSEVDPTSPEAVRASSSEPCLVNLVEVAKAASNVQGPSLQHPCCSNGCLQCCGGCCSDSTNCTEGCCPPR